MRASFGMAQERADALVELRADDVFEFAGLVVGFGVVHREGVFEQTLGEAVAADDVAGAERPGWRECDVTVVRFNQLQVGHAGEDARGRLVGD